MSHESRAPLNGVIGFTELVADDIAMNRVLSRTLHLQRLEALWKVARKDLLQVFASTRH